MKVMFWSKFKLVTTFALCSVVLLTGSAFIARRALGFAQSQPEAAKPQSKMAECNAKTKGMTKADADKARSECMKS